ncbi:O-antigen polysaccharide polymerase Wzy [Natrinema amylolyticum]|uniref:O-antigen polysaccharide polymerase Wzy n=1 Tax=Natrinema amylolyticum TaxID=2878679 RepID=UPI001CF9E077|nr:O-antigen polysaccharide polymerase Wzy [Natrinema amylolyticum]
MNNNNFFTYQLDKSDLTTIVTLIFALPLSVVVAIAPVSANGTLVVLAICGGAPIAVKYVSGGDFFAPTAFLGLGYLISVFGPVLDIAAFGPDDRRLLLGNDPEYLVLPMLLIVVYVAALMTGVALWSGRERRPPVTMGRWNHERARCIGLVFVSIGTVGFLALLLTTGGIPTSLSDLSTKRRPPNEYIRWTAQFLQYGSIILFANYLTSSLSQRWTSGILFGLSFLPATFLPFYTSQRSTLLLFLIALLVIAYYLDEQVTGAKLVSVVPTGIFLSNAMLQFRKASWQGASALEVGNLLRPESLIGFFEANRGNVVAHAHILHMVPEESGYRFGSTLFTWAVFPVPRAVWPSKPINLGQQLGVLIYARGEGIVGSGTPPFIAGELYLNFGIVGVLVGGLVLGVIVGKVMGYLRPSSATNPGLVIFYSIFATQFVVGTMRGDFSPTMVNTLKWVVVMVPAVIFAAGGIQIGRVNSNYVISSTDKSD